ncbi:mll0337 [Mesorhizobium japonicum MAFF 303099]|uniref:Mll0337 protein n=1 Tax=Mesorhizobium japonicum (strain LMG 29417 / CECT 9101 / MAFF 303099) TaxID=266835 RepID=Q98N23_RHILO|nr:mll0337 [Mesorhizobium japonicum MAFF 303099]
MPGHHGKNDRKRPPTAERRWDYDFGIRCSAAIALGSDLERFEKADDGHHVAFAGGASRDRFGVLPPMFDLPILVDMAGGPGSLGVELAEIDRQRQQRRTGQRGHEVDGGQPQRLGALIEMTAQNGDRLTRLLDMDDPLGKVEASPQCSAHPIDDRIPLLVLPLDQPLGGVGAVTEQIRRGKTQYVFQHRLRIARNTVDGGVDQAHHRHRHRIDGLALFREFVCNQHSRRLGRERQQRLARRAHRLAVEMHGETSVYRRNRSGLVEALGQRRLHLDLGATHRIRIRKILARFEVVEDVTHEKSLSHRCQLACRPVDDDQARRNQAKCQKNAHGQRLVQDDRAAQDAENRRQEGEAGQAGGRIAAQQPEPQDVGEGDNVDRLEKQRQCRQQGRVAHRRTGERQDQYADHRRAGELIEQQLFGARLD